MSKLGMATLVLAVTGFAAAARADGPAGDACAAKLTPDGKAVYTAAMAEKPTTETVKAVIEKEARSLAMGGKIARGSARDNAIAAGECVKTTIQ
ncbi:MAG: hypothetical protein ACHQPH_16865 [Reyranellales bacterium]|jgi:hypothetical protein